MLARINRFWRLIATAISYIFFGTGGVIFPLLALPFFYLYPGTRVQKQRRVRRLVHYIFKFFIHMMRTLGVLTWQTEHIERLQRPGLLVVANHPTLIDVVFLVAFMPHADCVVKSALRKNPAMRGFVSMSGFISNDNGERLITDSSHTLANGSALIVFPEGTRTEPVTTYNPLAFKFQRGAANIAVRTQCNLTPVTITCDPATLSKQHKWYYVPPKKVVMRFIVHPDIAIEPYTHAPASSASRHLTRDLEDHFTKTLQTGKTP